MITDQTDCENQAKAACGVLQTCIAWLEANTTLDLSTLHPKTTRLAQQWETALSMPAGSLSNPNDADPKRLAGS